MLPGFGGHLISEAFLEELARGSIDDPSRQSIHKKLLAWRSSSSQLGPAAGLRTMLTLGAEPLFGALGFEPPSALSSGPRFLATTLRGGAAPVALIVTAWGEPLEPFWRVAATEAIQRRAPWCLIFNGTHVRLIDAGRLFTRRCVEFDVEQTLDDRRTLAAFLTVVGAPSLGELIERSDRYAMAVSRSLRTGVLDASTEVLAALLGTRPGMDRSLQDAFEQALTIVYRIVFLCFAESRGLVPLWHPLYRDSYSLGLLRDALAQPQGAVGLWDALRAITRLAHAGCTAGDLRVTPFNGRLFAPARTPLAERRDLDDEAAGRALLALCTQPAADGAGRQPVAYRDLGVEQLGAVYETILDYSPTIDRPSGRGPAVVRLRSGSGTRKATGTFYTPQLLAEYLVRRTLGPLVREAEPDRILALRVLDPAMGSGAFLVAACRYLASAYEAALVRTGRWHPSDVDEPDRAAFRRLVAERCLYGVDLNPMAVQLARLSIWLTTLAGNRPLSFLDHRLQVGDSLLGTWLARLNRSPVPQRRRSPSAIAREPPLFDDLRARDALRELLPVRFALESVPNDTPDQVQDKERALAALNARGSALRRWRRVADLWCASWMAGSRLPSEAFMPLVDVILTDSGALAPKLAAGLLDVADQIASTRRFFHWELECPEIFFAADGARLADGGFDAVIGNPPWDMIRADNHDRGDRHGSPQQVLRFVREAGIYTAQSGGHANCYQLFTERAVALTRPGGRIGLIVPAGLATDRGSAALRQLLLTQCDVDALVGFDNSRGVFPIHRSIRFLLATATVGRPTDGFACRFGVQDPTELESIGEEPATAVPWFQVRMGPRLLARLSGDDLAIPWVRTPIDLAIAERAAALFPPLGGEGGWRARFGRDLNATDDRHLFCPAGDGLPLVEGKQIEPFRVDLGSTRWAIRARDARGRFRDRRHLRPRLTYRDVAAPTNQLTLIAAILPAGCVSTHTLFCLRTPLPAADQLLLCALFNSFVLNYLARLRVSTHVTTGIVEQLPVPLRVHAPIATRRLTALARLLSRRRNPGAYASLQASVARLYQLTAEEFRHVLSTFPLVPPEVRRAAVEAFATETQSPLR